MASAPSQLAGILAGRYAIERELGSGGTAIVYLAHDLKHGRRVAVKALHPELAASIAGERFLREIAIAATLQHPNILPLYDSGEEDGTVYYVMPYVEGESLRRRLVRESQLPIEDAIRIAREVADALAYAHDHGVVHRDIKPENVLLGSGHAIVADFGIARAVSAASAERLTQSGVAVGTPSYMSPEQGLTGEVDARSDIYSLACVLYELLVGEPPFGGGNAMAIIARHSAGAVPSLRVVRPSIPEGLEAVVLRALAKCPVDRFQSAAAFSEALAEFDMPEVMVHAPVPRVDASRIAQREWRGRIIMAVGALSVISLLAVGALIRAQRDGAASRPTRDPRTVAVLSLDTPNDGDSLIYLADAISEGLIQRLGDGDSITVLSHGFGPSLLRAVDLRADSTQREHDAGTLVEGTLVTVGPKVRVTVAVIDGVTGKVVDRDSVEGSRDDGPRLQDDVSLRVSRLLQRRLGQEIHLAVIPGGTRNVRAWDAFQRVRHAIGPYGAFVGMAGENQQAALRRYAHADSELARIEAMDTGWVEPIVARGWVRYSELLGAGAGDPACRAHEKPCAQFRRWLQEADSSAERALELVPQDAGALELRGTIRYTRWAENQAPVGWPPRKLLSDAEADLRESIQLNPRSGVAWRVLTDVLASEGKTRMSGAVARAAYNVGIEVSPAQLLIYGAFHTALMNADEGEATRWCAESGRRFPTETQTAECRLWLNLLKSQKPNVSELWASYRAFVDAWGKSTAGLEDSVFIEDRNFNACKGELIVALGLVRAGLPDSANRVATRARTRAAADPSKELVHIEAILRTWLHQKDEAFRLLRDYVTVHPEWFNEDEWWFEELWTDPRWRDLTAR